MTLWIISPVESDIVQGQVLYFYRNLPRAEPPQEPKLRQGRYKLIFNNGLGSIGIGAPDSKAALIELERNLGLRVIETGYTRGESCKIVRIKSRDREYAGEFHYYIGYPVKW